MLSLFFQTWKSHFSADFQDQEAHYAILMTVYNKMQRTHSHKTTRKALFKCYSIDVSIAFYCMGGGE